MGTGKNRPALKPAVVGARGRVRRAGARSGGGDPRLFEALTEGERADALRIVVEDKRLASMAKVGRYRLISVEPMVVKAPHSLADRRLASLVLYDYAADRCVEAKIDLDAAAVAVLRISRAQPMLARDEELAAIDIASADERVASTLALGDEALGAMHYWSNRESELSYSRRSAAVLFGRRDARPTLVAIVDLIDNHVADVVAAEQW